MRYLLLRSLHVLLCVIFLGLGCAQVAAQPAVIAKKSPPASKQKPAVTQELLVPFWTLEPGWTTHLEVRNNLASNDLDVTPVLRTSDGLEFPLAPVKLQSDRVRRIDLQAAAPSLSGRAGSYGSLLLRFTSVHPYNAYAAVMIQRLGHPIAFHFDAWPVEANFSSGSRDSIWWLPLSTSDGFLVVSNFDSKPVQARQIFTGGDKAPYITDLTLAPHQTQRVSIREVVQQAGFTATEGGIKLDFKAGAGSVYVAQMVFDETADFSALMKVFERDLNDKPDSNAIRAPLVGLATPDPMLGYPDGTVLRPMIFVRNVTDGPITAQMSVTWKSASSTGKIPLDLGTLVAQETRPVDFTALQSKGLPADANWANVEITYTGLLGDVIAVAASYDDTKRYGLQSPFSYSVTFMWKGGMWQVDPTHNTLITTGNAGDQTARVGISLFYGDKEVYELPEKLLVPGQQTWVDVGNLIRNQVADKNGRVMAPVTMEGSYEIRDLDAKGVGYLYEGKIITDKTFGHATYGCAECCMTGSPGYDSFDILDNPAYGSVGSGYQFTPWATNLCSGSYDLVAANAWSSSDTSVATIDYNTGYMSYLGAGTTTVGASSRLASVNDCCCRPQTFTSTATANVSPRFNVAYSSYIPVDHVSGPSNCPYVLDQSGSSFIPLIYMGDANRGTYRTAESIFIVPDLQQSSGFFPDTGETRNYDAFHSPVNGSTLSTEDEDGVAKDCMLFNEAGKASAAGFTHDESYPLAHQGQSHFAGSGSNPLEAINAPITWDMRTVIDTTNPLSPTAFVNFNHTCYPAHQVKVNGAVVYLYTPPRNDLGFIRDCLFFQTGKVIGQTSSVGVPPQ